MSIEEWLFQILETERALHPHMDVFDVQKLVYQAVYGIDHLLRDRSGFERALQAEWERIEDVKDSVCEALQVIGPEGRTARLHLVPCKALGIELKELTAFLRSQPLKNGKKEKFDRLWSSARALSREGRIPFEVSELNALPSPKGPAHHSKNYGPAAYRIINDTSHPLAAEWLRTHGVTQ